MSDPQTNVEIEDVLTSIRRLVSENEWSQPKAAPEAARSAADEQAPAGTQHDKFVLTPALRVVERANVAETARVAPQPVERSSQAVSTEPYVAEPSARTDVSDLERMIAELEAAVTGSETNFEPEPSEIEDLVNDPQPFPVVEPEPEVEDAVEETAEAVEPVAADDHEVAPESDDPDLGQLETDIDDFLENGSLIDEEKLRELVKETVRSELQGALGERITRNVRKLVNREIYRILSSQNYE